MSNEGLISGMKMQVTPQDNTQADGRAKSQFRRGQSGNASGRTRSMDRLAELIGVFVGVHSRQPDALEMINLRSAAKLAAAAESNRTSAQEAVRANNALHRTLSRLGMAKPLSRPSAATHIPLRDRLRSANGHQP
jgi:hypothetical protein